MFAAMLLGSRANPVIPLSVESSQIFTAKKGNTSELYERWFGDRCGEDGRIEMWRGSNREERDSEKRKKRNERKPDKG